jgi:hypothetical protein
MTSTARPRPGVSFAAKRPDSAIYIGQSSNIPDLPEPPSPGAVSNGSGLPSPPATNSTDSGSTNAGSLRQRSAPMNNNTRTMLNGNYGKTFHAAFHRDNRSKTHNSNDEENDNDTRDDEDDTARLDIRKQTKSPSENVLALQRVKSLTQRNRMVNTFS